MKPVRRSKHDPPVPDRSTVSIYVEDDSNSMNGSSQLGSSYSLPATRTLDKLIELNRELVEMGQRFNGMKSWTYQDMDRVVKLRAEIASLWVARRLEIAAIHRSKPLRIMREHHD